MLPHIQENQQEYPSNYIFVIEELESAPSYLIWDLNLDLQI
jgi:hypothetical protein